MWCFSIELKLKSKLLKYVAYTFKKIYFQLGLGVKRNSKENNTKILGVAVTEYYIFTV